MQLSDVNLPGLTRGSRKHAETTGAKRAIADGIAGSRVATDLQRVSPVSTPLEACQKYFEIQVDEIELLTIPPSWVARHLRENMASFQDNGSRYVHVICHQFCAYITSCRVNNEDHNDKNRRREQPHLQQKFFFHKL